MGQTVRQAKYNRVWATIDDTSEARGDMIDTLLRTLTDDQLDDLLLQLEARDLHDPEECGCEYRGNNMWSCGHIDGENIEQNYDGVCENCGALCHYDSEVCLCFSCQLRTVADGDECPICRNGTVEIVENETRCKGECGTVVKNSA